MSTFQALRIGASGLSAERLRMDTITSNISNAQTTRTEDGGPYIRKVAVFQEALDAKMKFNGVKAVAIQDDESDLRKVYDPTHVDADEEGYVTYPNVSTITEMTNLIDASRGYEANATAFEASKSIALKGLEMSQ